MKDKLIDLRWRRRARNRPERCPRCGSENLVPIVYGLPDDDTIDACKRGEISVGGCMVTDRSPGWICKDCHQRCGTVALD